MKDIMNVNTKMQSIVTPVVHCAHYPNFNSHMPYVYSLRTFHSASHLKPNYGGIYISSYTLIPTIQFYSTRHHQIVSKSVGAKVLFLDYPQFCQWFLYFSGLQGQHLIFDFSVLYSLPLSISYFFLHSVSWIRPSFSDLLASAPHPLFTLIE